MAFGLLRFICPRKTLCSGVGRSYRGNPEEDRKYAVQSEWKLIQFRMEAAYECQIEDEFSSQHSFFTENWELRTGNCFYAV